MTKKLIDRLEELADEMKVIVHQLRVPSTIAEDVIEFEGQQYKKVDREAREGDVVVFHHKGHEDSPVITGKPYPVNFTFKNEPAYHDGITESACSFRIYDWGRTTKNVDVYELMDGYNPQIPILEESNVKSPNQQRAEVIGKAMAFVDENGGDDYHFDIDEKKGTVFAYKVITPGVGRYGVKHGFSKCHPNDVFNADIGKAISFGRAERLDVSEFENAVQPNEFVIGQTIMVRNAQNGNTTLYSVTNLGQKEGDLSFVNSSGQTSVAHSGGLDDYYKIINDTNAEYEVNA